MKPEETRLIYQRECASRRMRTNNKAEFDEWHNALRQYEARDVEAGMRLWNSDTAPDAKGDPKCKWLPRAQQIVDLVEQAISRRIVRAAEQKEEWSWECAHCGHRVSGFIIPGADTKRYCPSIYGPIGSGVILRRGTNCGHDMIATRFESYEEAVAKHEAEKARKGVAA